MLDCMGARSTRKGKVGERELARALTDLFGAPHRRGTQFRSGQEEADVIGPTRLHWECKRCESLSLYKALDQSISDSRPGQVPLVAHRRNNQEWVVIVRLQDLPALAHEINRNDTTPPMAN